MKHFTAKELKNVLLKIRAGEHMTPEEAETLKMYIPLQLSKEQATEMAKMIEKIRTGKQAPLTPEEQAELHQKNMQQSLKNFIEQLPQTSDVQFVEVCNMCEKLRLQIAR